MSWDALYRLLEDEEHASSLPLIGVPDISLARASLSSRGALSDSDFRVWILLVRLRFSPQAGPFQSYRCHLTHENQQYLLSRENWALLQATEQLSARQIRLLAETTNQLGWAAIRKYAETSCCKI